MKLGWILHRTLRDFRRHSGAALVLGLGFCLTALLMGGYRLADGIAQGTGAALRDGAHVIAYLRDDVAPPQIETLQKVLGALPQVTAVRVVSSEEALHRLRREIPQGSQLLGGLEEGFLPASLEIALAPEPGVADDAEAIAARLGRIDGVLQVDSMGDELERLTSWLQVARTLGLLALALATVTVLLALGLAVHGAQADRRRDAQVLGLLGETPRMAGLPAALAGAAASFLGAGVGVAILYACFHTALGPLESTLGPLLAGAPRFLSGPETAVGLAAAAALGGLAGLRAARLPRALVRGAGSFRRP